MRQRWRDLLFLHFSCDPREIQPLLPPELEADTFEDRAWVGLVLFRMEGIRHVWSPALPWLSAFPETNVRTYVRHRGENPGVWFFSLDAARWLACRVARSAYCLPYHHARMTVRRQGDQVSYGSRRFRGGIELAAAATLGPELAPGPTEEFLIERYRLYAQRGSDLYSGMVAHRPYPLRQVPSYQVDTRLFEANGIASRPLTHAVFSEGVDVEVFPLVRA